MTLYGPLDMLTQETTRSHFLILFFQDFYYEVLRQKERVLSRRGATLEQDNDSLPQDTSNALTTSSRREEVNQILKIFQNILEEQALSANYEGGAFGAACYKEAQYIMAALADEIFLSISWEGRRYWENALLEQRLFGTHIAGDRFFKNLDAFLKERDPLKREIGVLYLTALGLGFRGKFRGFDDHGAIDHYREQLFIFIYHQKPALFEGRTVLFPMTTRSTLEGVTEQENQDIRTWFLVFLGVFVGYILLSYGIWYGVTHVISRATNAILEDARTFS